MGNADTRVRVLDLYCRQITLTLYILLQSQDLQSFIDRARAEPALNS